MAAQMEVSLIDKMGSDLTTVNAARVSFGKRKQPAGQYTVNADGQSYTVHKVEEGDKKLINYLAVHKHWTPFAHSQLQFHIKAPIFVARQLVKHQVGLVWNEISRRYVDTEPEFYQPTEWRLRAENKKQGSSDATILHDVSRVNRVCVEEYNKMLEDGIAPEMARMILPANIMTEWIWTGSLYAFANVCRLRMAPDAQKETREIANQIYVYCEMLFPVSWSALFAEANERSE